MRPIKSFSVRRKIILVCVLVTFAFIWGNSLMPSDISSQQSGWVEQLLRPVLDFIHSGRIQASLTRLADLLPPRINAAAYRVISWLEQNILTRDATFLVRKAAHFSEYMLLGFFLCLLLARADYRGRAILPWAICVAAAFVDEGIQYFSDGRTPHLRDVCIDTSGAFAGLIGGLILLAVLRLALRIQAHAPAGGTHIRPDKPESGKIS